MLSQKSERSYQDYLSICETDFLNIYFLQLVEDTISNLVCQSELEIRYRLNEKKIDHQTLLQQKRTLYVKPNKYMFALKNFSFTEAFEDVKKQITNCDFNEYDEKKSSQTRRKLYQQLITSSFSDDIPISQVNSWVVLNDIKLQIKKGDIILFIVKIKASSYTLNRLQTLINNEVQYTQLKLEEYIKKNNSNIYPILILNADINFPYQKLNCQTYYVGKQNLLYHFFKQLKLKENPEAITDAMVTNYNINRMSQSRLMLAKWSNEFKLIQKGQKQYIGLASIGIAITFGIVIFFKSKFSK